MASFLLECRYPLKPISYILDTPPRMLPYGRFPQHAYQTTPPPMVLLHLLSTPPSISLPHVTRRFNWRNKLQRGIHKTYYANSRAKDYVECVIGKHDRADEDVEDSATKEGEEERCVTRDLWWDLEFCCVTISPGGSNEWNCVAYRARWLRDQRLRCRRTGWQYRCNCQWAQSQGSWHLWPTMQYDGRNAQ